MPSPDDFDAADFWLVDGANEELDGDLAAGVGGGGELADVGLVLRAGGGEDIKVGEDACAVDVDVEFALVGGAPINLGEVEADGVAGVRGEAGDGIGVRAPAFGLVDGGRVAQPEVKTAFSTRNCPSRRARSMCRCRCGSGRW